MLIADGIDHDMRPEPGAIFTIPPAFAFELPATQGNLQIIRRHPGELFGFAIEETEVATDDLIAQVPFCPAGALIPANDRPVGAQHIDGIIFNAFNKVAIGNIRQVIVTHDTALSVARSWQNALDIAELRLLRIQGYGLLLASF